jgi:hypothetical protein
MITQDNLLLSRTEPDGQGGTQFIYRIESYGVSATTRPQEELSRIHWEVEVIKFKTGDTVIFDICHTTKLADKTLKLYNDSALNEFLDQAFTYLKELNSLENMLPESG